MTPKKLLPGFKVVKGDKKKNFDTLRGFSLFILPRERKKLARLYNAVNMSVPLKNAFLFIFPFCDEMGNYRYKQVV